MAISQRLRFEVLRRDHYTCQYCGASAPATTIVVDHVLPVALGGLDKAENLLASCEPCNIGKASTVPTDHEQATAAKRQADYVAVDTTNTEAVNAFRDHWTSAFDTPPPTWWKRTIMSYVDQGLTSLDIVDAIGITESRDYVADPFPYFCGVCRNMIAQWQEDLADQTKPDDSDNYPAWLNDDWETRI